MLQTIGVQPIEELFSDIPESVRFKGDCKIKEAKSEPELLRELSQMAKKNPSLKEYDCRLYTADAAIDLVCVDVSWRRIMKQKNC